MNRLVARAVLLILLPASVWTWYDRHQWARKWKAGTL